jgi:hypothetical protein
MERGEMMQREKFFKANEGTADRVIRAIVGLVFIYLGHIYTPWLYIIAALGLITAADGFCGLYWLMGWSTKK